MYRGFGEKRTAFYFLGHPLTKRDDVELAGVEGVPVGLSLTRPDGAGQVFLTVRSELGALPTAVPNRRHPPL